MVGQWLGESPDWRAEYAALSERDRRAGGLRPQELERLSVAAFLLGHDDEATTLRERAYHAHLSGGEISAAVRCAFWLGFHLQNRGDLARSSGWLSTLQRLVATADEEPLTGLMLLASAAAMMTDRDDPEGALPLFEQAARIAESSGDLDAFVLAGLGRGQCLELTGQPIDAVTALDEVMVHVLGGAVAEQLVGFAYCSTIVLCMHHFDVRRAQEWTSALTRWCDDQSGLVPYRGACQVYRAEILQLKGAWPAAMSAAQDACRQLGHSVAAGSAHYRLAELHRLQGRFDEADREYSLAAELGTEVQPGLARLRAAQRNPDAAMAGLDRALGEDPRSPARPALQAARIEIALAVGDLAAARAAAEDLELLATEPCAPFLTALAAFGDGALRLAEGDARGAIGRLRRAWTLWQQRLDAPLRGGQVPDADQRRVLGARRCGRGADGECRRPCRSRTARRDG